MRKRRVVVAGQEHPGAGERLQRLDRTVDGAVRDLVAVEGVAGDEHRVDAALPRQLRDAPHGLKALGPQLRARVPGDAGEGLADLPIGRVDESECHLDRLGIQLRN